MRRPTRRAPRCPQTEGARMFAKLRALAQRHFQHRLTRWRRPRSLYLLSRRLRPLSASAGTDRGRPLDRYFIEKFLEANRDCVRGVCLEVKDNAYTLRYGG